MTADANVCANAQRQTRHHATTNGAAKGEKIEMQNLERRCYAMQEEINAFTKRLDIL